MSVFLYILLLHLLPVRLSLVITIGLAQQVVRSVLGTPDGILWMAVGYSGLSSSNGVEFKTFSLPGDARVRLNVLDAAVDGSIWMGTDNGIRRHFQGQTQLFPFNETLPRKVVVAIQPDANGAVWFGTYSGLGKYDGQNFVTFTVKEGLPSNMIWSLMRARDGILWVGTDNGVARFDGQSFSCCNRSRILTGAVSKKFTRPRTVPSGWVLSRAPFDMTGRSSLGWGSRTGY